MTYLPMGLLTIVAIVSLMYAEFERGNLKCTDVVIFIEKNPSHSDFITEDDVYQMFGANRNMLIGKDIAEINIMEMESAIESNPTVLSCETFFTIKGELQVVVKQRNPVLRVASRSSNFYIDEGGVQMPLSERASARVIVVSGEISDSYNPNQNIWIDEESVVLQNVFTLASKIRNDDVFLPMIEQIYVTQDQEIVLGSKLGPSRIEFGSIDGCDIKLKHLKAFFKAEKVRENWHQYKAVSLKYKNQIVCTKK